MAKLEEVHQSEECSRVYKTISRVALAMIKIEEKRQFFLGSEAERAPGVQRPKFVFDVLLSGKEESGRERLLAKKANIRTS